ncbi:MAG: thiaminase II [Gammaproteobacteria bacterium]|nr:thiaminase II [Gammaproteobacteria bacterium]
MSDDGLFARLKASCRDDWDTYVRHPFVRQLGDGTLPEACFQHYLKQDYLFLIHFARAYALAVYKSSTLADMRHAKDTLSALLDTELRLHVDYCAEWGIDEAALEALPEATANMAYTRYVLEVGQAGDALDLHVALAPCVIGYAQVAEWLMGSPATLLNGNPYKPWIDMYASDEYQEAAAGAAAQLDDLAARLAGPRRLERLQRIFDDATRLEIGFWQMGLDLSV